MRKDQGVRVLTDSNDDQKEEAIHTPHIVKNTFYHSLYTSYLMQLAVNTGVAETMSFSF